MSPRSDRSRGAPRATPAPHAPRIGRVGRLAGRFHITGAFWYRANLFAARRFPSSLVPPTVRAVTLVVQPFLRSISRAVDANLTAALGSAGRWTRARRVHRTLYNFGWCLTERNERFSGKARLEMAIEGMDAWRAATSGNRGAIMVTAHIGSWETGSALPTSGANRHVHLVREEETDPETQALVEELLKTHMGDRYTTHFAGRDPTLAVRLLEALKRGDLVALQGDRPRAGGRTCRVRLFDRDFELPVGPLALARSAGVAILPAFVFRKGRRDYRVVFHEPFRVDDGGDRRAVLGHAAQRLADAIERAIREDPFQWFCFRRLWDAEGRYLPAPHRSGEDDPEN